MDIEPMAVHMLPAGSVFKFLADHRYELFPDDTFEDLFPSVGVSAHSGSVTASVMVS